MNIFRTIWLALRALSRNKVRSFLTVLGIIIGVASIIAMVSIGQGAKAEVERRFESMGTNLLFVRPGSASFQGRQSGGGTYANLTVDDANAIIEKCDAVKFVSPTVSLRAQVVYGNRNWNTSIQGVGSAYPEIRNWPVSEGSFFDENHVRTGANVCLLGSEVKSRLFESGDDPVGSVIRVRNSVFVVIGVLKSLGESGGWFNRDDMIVVPYTTALNRLLNVSYINSIDVSAVSMARSDEAKKQIEETLRIRHDIARGGEDDFNVRNMSEIAESAVESAKTLTLFLFWIAAIALVVGGIGIMNIMLVSVTERTREIGIRLAVGAREQDVLAQFLIEAIVLSVLGGLIGIAIGVAASEFVSRLTSWRTSLSIGYTALAFFSSSIVGIFFGFYPARKASRMDPIEALRYE